jgi:glutamyl-tRNA synthetase
MSTFAGFLPSFTTPSIVGGGHTQSAWEFGAREELSRRPLATTICSKIITLPILTLASMASSNGSVRVRFAPSPTGKLHIGGLRTALYNYLFARQHDGEFLLRIEDTDQARYVEDAEEDLLDALSWTGLSYDEGPTVGGPHAPYYQSKRAGRYRQYAEQLVEDGHAYVAFDTEAEIEAMRERLRAEGVDAPAYDASTRTDMTNSLTLSDEEVQQRLDAGEEHVIRLKVPTGESVHFDDVIRGHVSFETDGIDDQVLMKSDGLPTYHLANVVDDHQMEISHVIRGEEWLSSTPKHILMYDAFGWTPPTMAHLPLIMSPQGGKLSKRDADALGVPVHVTDYRTAGYEPEALVNFLALLGWNPGTEQELFSLDALVDAFSLDRVGASGVQFDIDKLNWFNEQHIHALSIEALVDRARPFVEAEGYDVSDERLYDICELLQERIQRVPEIATENRYFFEDPETYEEKGVQKRWKDDSADLLDGYADRLEALDGFDVDDVETVLRDLADEHDVGAGRVIHPTRLAVSGRTFGPGVFSMMVVVGKDACLRRMRRAAKELG